MAVNLFFSRTSTPPTGPRHSPAHAHTHIHAQAYTASSSSSGVAASAHLGSSCSCWGPFRVSLKSRSVSANPRSPNPPPLRLSGTRTHSPHRTRHSRRLDGELRFTVHTCILVLPSTAAPGQSRAGVHNLRFPLYNISRTRSLASPRSWFLSGSSWHLSQTTNRNRNRNTTCTYTSSSAIRRLSSLHMRRPARNTTSATKRTARPTGLSQTGISLEAYRKRQSTAIS